MATADGVFREYFHWSLLATPNGNGRNLRRYLKQKSNRRIKSKAPSWARVPFVSKTKIKDANNPILVELFRIENDVINESNNAFILHLDNLRVWTLTCYAWIMCDSHYPTIFTHYNIHNIYIYHNHWLRLLSIESVHGWTHLSKMRASFKTLPRLM